MARFPKPTNKTEEKKQYIALMLLDSFEAHAGDIDAAAFLDTVPSGPAAAAFARDVKAMFNLELAASESVRSLVDRIYAADGGEVVTAAEFVKQG